MLPFAERVDWDSFAIIIERGEMLDLEHRLREADIPALQAGIARVRHMMTYDYTCRYILEYLSGKGAPSAAGVAPNTGALLASMGGPLKSIEGSHSLFSSVAITVKSTFS